MGDIRPTTIFSNSPTPLSEKTEKNIENRKLSYWLEKLHIQGEQVRKDENRREKRSKVGESMQPLNEQVTRETDQDLTHSRKTLEISLISTLWD